MVRVTLLAVAIVSVFGLLLGCATPVAPTETAPASKPAAAAVSPTSAAIVQAKPAKTAPRGSLVFAVEALGPQRGDPQRISIGTERIYTLLMADGLVVHTADGKLAPGIASSWTVSADGLTWDFTIRKGVKFHNGDEVTPEDVVFSFKRALDPKYENTYAPEVAKVFDKAEVNGDHVILRFKAPYAVLLDRLALFFAIVPKKYVEQVGDDGFDKKPIAAGPFKLVENKIGEYMKFEAFEEHYRKVPEMKTLTLKLVPEPSTRAAMLKSGEADIDHQIPPSLAEDYKRTPGVQIMPMKYGRSMFLKFFDLVHPESSPFKDLAVRQAISYAIDREALVKQVYYGYAVSVPTPLPPHMIGYDPSMKAYPYDPEKAKKLLADAGYAGGFSTVLHGGTGDREAVQAIAGMLEKVGIKTTIDVKPLSAYVADSRGRKQTGIGYWPHSGLSSWELSGMDNNLSSYGTYGYTNNPALDELFRKSTRVTDDAKRAAITNEAQKMLYDQIEVLGLLNIDTLFAVGPKIKEWDPGVAGQSGMLENVVLK